MECILGFQNLNESLKTLYDQETKVLKTNHWNCLGSMKKRHGLDKIMQDHFRILEKVFDMRDV
jgi:hypothetical protein